MVSGPFALAHSIVDGRPGLAGPAAQELSPGTGVPSAYAVSVRDDRADRWVNSLDADVSFVIPVYGRTS
ncbi:hypothetical protein FB460_1480 [Propioniferax innocua]|uniref:Uncharacterized protein n=2 Tax=Propioniferax innocua TaxID=1753 RepID=A0A542ZBC5_9ACTN|nr:hypothetical protein FB460_1480 [Propioniferax innocua]